MDEKKDEKKDEKRWSLENRYLKYKIANWLF